MLTDLGKLRYQNGGNTNPAFITIHSATPSADGTTNRIGTPIACVFDDATLVVPGSRFLSEDVIFTISASTSFSHYCIYNSAMECLHIISIGESISLVNGDRVILQGSLEPRLEIIITST